MPDATFWNDIAEEYAARPVEIPDAFERKIEITKALMNPNQIVLDIGCGTGSLALRLAETGAELHGLDLSKEMVRIAKNKAFKAETDNVTFHTGAFDQNFEVFSEESLDGICAYSFLHLVEDHTAALKLIFQLLKPGGFLVASTPCLGESWVPYSMIIPVMQWLGKAPFVKVIDKRAVELGLDEAGFVQVRKPDVGAKAATSFIVAKKP